MQSKERKAWEKADFAWQNTPVVCLDNNNDLLRGLNQLFTTAVHIHPATDVKLASEGVSRVSHRLSSQSPDSPCFVLEDFNKCRLNRVLPHFKQYVTCITYKDKTIDLCTFRQFSGPGRSGHNKVHLVPAYIQKLKRSKPLTRSVKTWSNVSEPYSHPLDI